MKKQRTDPLIIAFLQGAKWWEFRKSNATMWQSDQALAVQKAIDMKAEGRLGIPFYTQLTNMQNKRTKAK